MRVRGRQMEKDSGLMNYECGSNEYKVSTDFPAQFCYL